MTNIGERLSKLSPAKLEIVARELERARKQNEQAREPIAIVGMGCRMPGDVRSPKDLWDVLVSKRDVCSRRPEDRDWIQGIDVPGYYLEDPYRFDAELFGISSREARGMDPQHRLLLELAWQGLEDAGVSPRNCPTVTGVFVGLYGNDYAQQLLWSGDAEVPDAHTTTGTNHGAAVGRVSHLLGLTGPALCFDTACSSSLVAIHEACAALRRGECELALAGGVSLMLSAQTSFVLKKANMLSPDGRSKTFDDAADGYGRGEGGGLLVLKRLSDARASGDPIRAIIRGSHVNHDGRASTLTAPNVRAQAEVIRKALGLSGVGPDEISVLECHGTGTPLGDPIEVRGLRSVFSSSHDAERPLFLTAVKSSLGHLEAAAGVAGVMKMVLALQNKCIPPTLHVEKLNSELEGDTNWIRIASESQPWVTEGKTRKAGVSSFGFGGTNAHLVLEEAPEVDVARDSEGVQPGRIVTLSARTPRALRSLAQSCATTFETAPVDFDDLCRSLNRRTGHAIRVAVDALSREDTVGRLRELAQRDDSSFSTVTEPRLVFMFTGQGAQFPDMGKWLFENVPIFRDEMLCCEELLRPDLDRSLTSLIFGADRARLHLTQYAQPALFAFEVSLARLWAAMGVKPEAVIGHSVGEFVAAHLAGVFDLETGLSLISERGRLMGEQPSTGGMVALHCPVEKARQVGDELGLDLAAENGPEQVVLSGASRGIEKLKLWAEKEGVRHHCLDVSHAFHSSLMDPVAQKFAQKVEQLELSRPTLPYFSNVTGQLVTDEVTSADYWARHLRRPVLFAQGLRAVQEEGFHEFLEVGPRPVLAGLARVQQKSAKVVASFGSGIHPQDSLSTAASRLFVLGADINWEPLKASLNRSVAELPPYPFQGESLRHPATVRGERRFTEAFSRSDREKLLGSPRLVPGTSTMCFAREIVADDLEIASQHRLEDSVVVPGAYYVALGLAAAELTGRERLALADIQFRAPLGLASGQTSELVSSLDDDLFQVASSSGADSSTIHARMRIVGSPSAPATSLVDFEGQSVGDFYGLMAQRGFHLGPGFRWLHDVRAGEGVAEATMICPSECAQKAIHLHPGFLDSCFQALAAAAVSLQSLGDGLFVPVSVDSLQVNPGVSGPLTIRVEIDKERSSPETLIGDIVVASEAGIYFSAQRLCARPLDVSAVTRGSRLETMSREVSFVAGMTEDATGPFTIALDGFSEAERSELEGTGQLKTETWMDHSEDAVAVVFNTTNVVSDLPARLEDALKLVREMVDLPGRRLRLYLVTRSAEAVLSSDDIDPYGAAWGALARCIAVEHPELWGGHIDVDAKASLGQALRLAFANSGESTVAVRQGTPYVARLSEGPKASSRALEIERDGSYLVTGGLGALGQHAAQWLVEAGGGRVVLVGRSSPSVEQIDFLNGLRQSGSTVEYVQVDCQNDRLIEALVHSEDPVRPWRGVIHAAGVLSDGALVNQNWRSFQRVMAPKVGGAERILATPGMDALSWCVFFSSAAAMLGSPGQGNYAFANGFLDGLAKQICLRGGRAVSIGFGPFAGAGMAAGKPTRSLELMTPLEPGRLGKMLEWALRSGRPHVGIFDVDLDALRAVYPSTSFLAARTAAPRRSTQSEIRSRLVADDLLPLPEDEATDELAARLAEQLGVVLGQTTNQLPVDRSLHSLGLDSLTSLEFKSSLEKSLNVQLAISDLLAGPSLRDVSVLVLEQMRRKLPPPEQAHECETDDLDDSQVTALLSLLSEESTDVAS